MKCRDVQSCADDPAAGRIHNAGFWKLVPTTSTNFLKRIVSRPGGI